MKVTLHTSALGAVEIMNPAPGRGAVLRVQLGALSERLYGDEVRVAEALDDGARLLAEVLRARLAPHSVLVEPRGRWVALRAPEGVRLALSGAGDAWRVEDAPAALVVEGEILRPAPGRVDVRPARPLDFSGFARRFLLDGMPADIDGAAYRVVGLEVGGRPGLRLREAVS